MATTITEPTRQTAVAYDVDVCVVGGGPGGLCAAVAAARNGARTLLVERYGFLGGMATAGLVNPFMNFHVDGEPIIAGIFAEWIEGMRARDGYMDVSKAGHNVFDPEAAMASAMELCLASGVQLLLHCVLDRAMVEDGRITHAVVAGKTRVAIAAKQFIDGTGDGDLAALAGATCVYGRDEDGATQPMTLCFNMKGVDWDAFLATQTMDKAERDRRRAAMQDLYDKARVDGAIVCPRENVLYFAAMHDDEVHFNTTRVIGRNATDSVELTAAEIESRVQAEQFVRWLRATVPGFENAYLSATAAQIGIRESRRVTGLYEVTRADVLECRKFADGITRAHYAIDIHSPTGSGTVIEHLPEHDWYEVPYRSLVPVGVKNLLIASRCVSSDHAAHSSLRVMPIVAGIGQAAGVAAAMAVREGVSPADIDGVRVVAALIEQGQSLVPTGENINTAS